MDVYKGKKRATLAIPRKGNRAKLRASRVSRQANLSLLTVCIERLRRDRKELKSLCGGLQPPDENAEENLRLGDAQMQRKEGGLTGLGGPLWVNSSGRAKHF